MNQTSPRAAQAASALNLRRSRIALVLSLTLLPVAAMAAAARPAILAYAGDRASGVTPVTLVQAADGSLHAAVTASAPVAAADAGTPPAAPSVLSVAVSQDGSEATLTWNGVDGANGYNVYEGSTPGGEAATPIFAVTGTSATITGLHQGDSYYFTVAAYNDSGISGFSPEARIVPETAGGALAPSLLGLLFGGALLRRRKTAA